mmetsp:Transcript_15866/g.23377  ORF Transcript_15866/g.23377 Transcript_15866/m.23377 type:complete len:120 (-) Transcript_15866:438-797(-)
MPCRGKRNCGHPIEFDRDIYFDFAREISKSGRRETLPAKRCLLFETALGQGKVKPLVWCWGHFVGDNRGLHIRQVSSRLFIFIKRIATMLIENYDIATRHVFPRCIGRNWGELHQENRM